MILDEGDGVFFEYIYNGFSLTYAFILFYKVWDHKTEITIDMGVLKIPTIVR